MAAHRGASSVARENTLSAFEKAIAAGADMIEFDVRRTRDDELVVIHDAMHLGRSITDWTLEELRESLLEGPPTFGETITAIAGRALVDVELKVGGLEAEVLEILASSMGPDTYVITSFLDDVLLTIKALAPDVLTGLILGRENPEHLVATRLSEILAFPRAEAAGVDFIVPHHRLLRFGLLTRAAKRGIPVLVWTVNDRRALRRLLSDRRVIGLISDIPQLAVPIRDEIVAESPAAG